MRNTDFIRSKVGSMQRKLFFICLIWGAIFSGTAYLMILKAEGLAQENNLIPSLLLSQFFVLGLIVLLGMLFLFLAFTRSVVLPIRALIQTTDAITSENPKAATKAIADDEMGQLALAFKRMTATLHETLVSKMLLKRSEEQFRKIFLSSNEAILLVNVEQDEIKEANTSACSLLGFTREGLLSKTCSDIYSGNVTALQIFFDGVYKNGNGWSDELLCRVKSGETLSTEIFASAVKIDGISCINALVRDISAQKKSRKCLEIASAVMKSIENGIIVTDSERNIQGVNPAFTEVTGYTQQEVIGKNARIFKSGLQTAAFYKKMWAVIDEKGRWKGEIWNRRKDGEIYPEGLAISVIKNLQGKVTNYVAIFSDLSMRKRQEERLKPRSFHDALTGFPNWILFQDRLRQSIAQERRGRRMIALLFLGLDGLKTIHETIGQDNSDILLRSVGGRLKRSIRGSDPISRVGENEFAIILRGAATTHDIEEVAKKILHSISQPFSIDSDTISVNISIGISFYPFDSKNVEVLITKADAAMCLAKKTGENRYQVAGKL